MPTIFSTILKVSCKVIVKRTKRTWPNGLPDLFHNGKMAIADAWGGTKVSWKVQESFQGKRNPEVEMGAPSIWKIRQQKSLTRSRCPCLISKPCILFEFTPRLRCQTYKINDNVQAQFKHHISAKFSSATRKTLFACRQNGFYVAGSLRGIMIVLYHKGLYCSVLGCVGLDYGRIKSGVWREIHSNNLPWSLVWSLFVSVRNCSRSWRVSPRAIQSVIMLELWGLYQVGYI